MNDQHSDNATTWNSRCQTDAMTRVFSRAHQTDTIRAPMVQRFAEVGSRLLETVLD